MHLSFSFLAFPSVSPTHLKIHSVKLVKKYIYASSSTSYKLLIALQFNTNTQETLPELGSHAQQASTGPGNIQICAIFPIISTLLECSPHPNL